MASRLQVKKYTEDHEWIELDEGGKIGAPDTQPHSNDTNANTETGTIGITNYASKALGDVVYVELPELGLEVSKGDTIGAVESVKSASDIMTPVSGTIKEANAVLEEKPGVINKGPEAEGWLAKIEVTDAAELEGLMTAEEYEAFEKE